MVDWAHAEAILDQGIATVFDQTPFRVRPRKDGASVNAKAVDDLDRVGFDFMGTLDIGSPGDRFSGLAADPAPRAAPVRFEGVVTARDGGWPYIPKRGDHLVTGDTAYAIADFARDGSRRRVFYVNRV